jgi:hypothetical protein
MAPEIRDCGTTRARLLASKTHQNSHGMSLNLSGEFVRGGQWREADLFRSLPSELSAAADFATSFSLKLPESLFKAAPWLVNLHLGSQVNRISNAIAFPIAHLAGATQRAQSISLVGGRERGRHSCYDKGINNSVVMPENGETLGQVVDKNAEKPAMRRKR